MLRISSGMNGTVFTQVLYATRDASDQSVPPPRIFHVARKSVSQSRSALAANGKVFTSKAANRRAGVTTSDNSVGHSVS